MSASELPLALRVFTGEPIQQLSDADFMRCCEQNPFLRLERTPQRDIELNFLVGGTASEAMADCLGQLWHWNRQMQLGKAFGSTAGFELPDKSVRSPNASWVSTAAWESRLSDRPDWFPTLCPAFVLEVKSHLHELAAVQVRMENYLLNGVQLGFLLDVEAETAYIYRPGQPAETVTGYEQELSGEPVLPGFRLDLRPLRRA